MMPVLEAHKTLSRHRTDEVVVTTATAILVWPTVSTRVELDIESGDAMAKASSVGLGLALARPDRRVLVLDADGSLLMNLGTLATIAQQAPRNLVHFVFQNSQYEITGGQPIPAVSKLSFVKLALGAGYPRAYEFDRLEDFEAKLDTILHEDGPVLVCLKVTPVGYRLPLGARRTLQAMPELMAALAKG